MRYVAASAGALSNGILTASYAGLDVTGGGYVLQNQEDGVAFYKFEGARSMKPFRAYIPATGASGAKTLNIVKMSNGEVKKVFVK